MLYVVIPVGVSSTFIIHRHGAPILMVWLTPAISCGRPPPAVSFIGLLDSRSSQAGHCVTSAAYITLVRLWQVRPA